MKWINTTKNYPFTFTYSDLYFSSSWVSICTSGVAATAFFASSSSKVFRAFYELVYIT